MGFETIAIARGAEKESFAKELGAHHYIDSTTTDVAAELKRLGGGTVVLATVTDAQAMSVTIPDLRPGASSRRRRPARPLAVSAADLVMGGGSVAGQPPARREVRRHPPFAALTGVRPMIETYPLEKAAEGSTA